MTSLLPEGGRQRLRWFLKVNPGGAVEDLLTGTEAKGLFVEMLYVLHPCNVTMEQCEENELTDRPSAKPQPAEMDPAGPLIPGSSSREKTRSETNTSMARR